MSRSLAIAGLVIGVAALVLQFAITVPAAMEAGRALLPAIVFYFSFFTILTNALLVLVYAGALATKSRWLSRFRKPVTRATAAAAIALVAGFYHFVLAGQWQPEGLFLIADIALHYVTPALYLIWYAAWCRSGTLQWRAIPAMLIAPAVYVGYALLRGAMIGEYPYAVLDAATLGYLQVSANIAGLIILFVALSAIAIAIDRSPLWLKPN